MQNFDKIYQDNYPKMYCVALKMIHDKDAVYDILQDVFAYYYQKLQKGHIIIQPKSWLYKATIHKCIDYSRFRNRYARIDNIEPFQPKEEENENKANIQMFMIGLSKLRTTEKTLILLYGEGMSYREISEITHIKFSSIGKMISRTIKKLDGILKKMNYEMY